MRNTLRFATVLAALFALTACGPDLTLTEDDYLAAEHVFGGTFARQEPTHGQPERSSRYLTMRDGVRIAVDIYLPESMSPGEKLPAIVDFTRYWRGYKLNGPFALLERPPSSARFFVPYGYAVVWVDARGSGASFGRRSRPWSAEEIADSAEVIDWVAAQDWCSGKVAASGISYAGTAAEFAGVAGSKSLKAVLPTYSLFDAYADIAFPGGVFNVGFVQNWGKFNNALDANTLPDVLPSVAGLAVGGVRPVDGAEDLLDQAVAEHATNLDIYKAALDMNHRDDPGGPERILVDSFSPHARVGELARAMENGLAVYSWGGWLDGAYADSLLNRHLNLPGGRAVIGPWNHAGGQHVSPFWNADAPTQPSGAAQLLEQKRFLEHYHKGIGPRPEDGIIFATMARDCPPQPQLPDGYADLPAYCWQRTDVWPPKGLSNTTLYMNSGQNLAPEAPAGTGHKDYDVDFSAATGETNRWVTQLGRSDVYHPDRAEQGGKLLVYRGAPLETDLEITGSPTLTAWVSSNRTDGHLFAYLECENPQGRVHYLTEGQLRLSHRALSSLPYVGTRPPRGHLEKDARPMPPGEPQEIVMGLWSTSVVVPKGWRLRLALGGADDGQFARLPEQGDATLSLHFGPQFLSRLELPSRPR